MEYNRSINYKKVFIYISFGGIIYVYAISPFIRPTDDSEKIIKIPSEFSASYIVDISSSPYAVSMPIIPSFN